MEQQFKSQSKNRSGELYHLFSQSKSSIADLLIQHLPIHFFLVDVEGYVAWGNDSMLAAFKLSTLDDFVGEHLSKWGKERWLLCKKVIRNQKDCIEEESINGRYYLSHYKPFMNPSNGIIGVIGISIDITERKLAEVRDSIITQTAGNLNLYWKDKEGRYLGCNTMLAKIFKLNSPEEVIGKNDFDFFLEDQYVEKIIAVDRQVISSGKEIVLEEIGTGIDGNLVTYLTKKAPLRDKRGTIVGVMGASVDITKQKQAEVAQRQFVENMEHDLRTPFSGIYGFATLLHAKVMDPKQKEMLGWMITSAQQWMNVINQILGVLDAEDLSCKPRDFNIQNVINDVVDFLIAKIKLKGLQLKVNCPSIVVHSDPLQIHRILLNLIANAVKFTEKGGITLTVSVDPKLKIKVTDTGIGIPANKFEDIFDKFVKLLPSNRDGNNFHGLGLGLYLSRQYARALGGDITVESTFGEGTTFTFYLN